MGISPPSPRMPNSDKWLQVVQYGDLKLEALHCHRAELTAFARLSLTQLLPQPPNRPFAHGRCLTGEFLADEDSRLIISDLSLPCEERL